MEQRIKNQIRDIVDFPKPGIVFKDITPLFTDPALCRDIVDWFCEKIKPLNVDAIACVEARGYFFGPQIASQLDVPFIPIRKKGKLPYKTREFSYDLEYGSATIEVHEDAIQPEWNVMIHDDLLATGGTAAAAAELVGSMGHVAGFSFLVDLTFLKGSERLQPYSKEILSLVNY